MCRKHWLGAENRKWLNWKTVILTAIGAAAAGLLRSEYEKNQLSTEETEIISKKIKEPHTLVYLTDLHDKEFGKGNIRLIEELYRIQPDAILLGGDILVAGPKTCSLDVTQRLLKSLVNVAPVYYANGNHEQRLWRKRERYGTVYRDFRRLLNRFHITYLSDHSAELGSDLRISGLNLDPEIFDKVKPKLISSEKIEEHLGAADNRRFQILLAHSPLAFDAYAKWGADLTLSGHFHGGTIRLPLLGGVMTPQYQFFHPYCAGTFVKGKHGMLVSRGLGTHSIRIRFNNKPQILVLRLKPER